MQGSPIDSVSNDFVLLRAGRCFTGSCCVPGIISSESTSSDRIANLFCVGVALFSKLLGPDFCLGFIPGAGRSGKLLERRIGGGLFSLVWAFAFLFPALALLAATAAQVDWPGPEWVSRTLVFSLHQEMVCPVQWQL